MAKRRGNIPSVQPDLERRYLTIGFVDLVGSTSLAERLDPEDLKSIYARIRHLCFEAVSKLGGSVVSPAGDGVLFEFGFPRTRENDAERALVASLAIIQQVQKTDFGPHLSGADRVQARIGVCSGLVLVGLDEGASWTIANSIVGEAANVAHRLQSLAGPNQIIVDEETIESVRDVFDLRPLGPLSVAGLVRRVEAFQLLQRSYRRRGGRPHRPSRVPAPIFGRDAYLGKLGKLWDQTVTERSLHIVEVRGEAGIGKTRLIEEFCRRFVPHDRVFSLQCFDVLASTPLHPFTNFMLARAGARPDEPDWVQIDRVLTCLAELPSAACHDRQIVASALGLPIEAGEGGPLAPRQRKKGEFALLVDAFADLCSGEPSLLVLEDVHWLDPSSKELLPQILERLGQEPVLVLTASRVATFGSAPGAASIVLGPLSPDESLEVARSLSREQGLPDDALRDIIRRSDGIPFFIEQLVVAHAVEARQEGLAASGRSARDRRAGLTLSLAELLFDRLDRFPEAKQVMRAISAFGQPVGFDTIAAVIEAPRAELLQDLDLLVEEGILVCPLVPPVITGVEATHPTAEYDFRHALLQRACYESMVSPTREELHRRICQVLAAQTASGVMVPISTLAHHLFQGALYEQAAAAWLQGGVESARRSANAEAIDLLTKARTAVEKIVQSTEVADLRLKILAALIGPLGAVRGFSAPDLLECCLAGLEQCPPNDTRYVFPFTYARFTSEISLGQVKKALASAEAFENLSRTYAYEPGEVIGGRIRAMALFALGRTSEAEAALRKSIAAYQPLRDESIAYLYGSNSKVTGGALLSLVLFYRGKAEEAAELGCRTLKDADEIRHPLSTGIALAYIGAFIPAYCGLKDLVQAQAERMYTFSTEHRLRIFTEYGRFFTAWASHQPCNSRSTIETMFAATHQLEQFSWRLTLPSMLALLGELLVDAGRFTEAEAVCDRALNVIREGGERWGLSEVLRVKAVATAAHRVETGSLKALSERAVFAARKNQTPIFEVRALRTALELGATPQAGLERLQRRYTALAEFRPDVERIKALLTA